MASTALVTRPFPDRDRLLPRYSPADAEDGSMTRLAHAPLLCELHAHTTWSDGSQTIGQLVDSYGQAGFDVLCITDHVVRRDEAESTASGLPQHVHARNHATYVMAIEIEAARARVQYDMLVLPGLELTYDDADPLRAAHAVAVGLESFVAVDDGIECALREARRQGAALIAAHPYAVDVAEHAPRATGRFAAELASTRATRRPLGADQPQRRVRLGGRGGTAGRRHGRRPPRRARPHLEDDDLLPQGARCRALAPALPGADIPDRRRACRARASHRLGVRLARRVLSAGLQNELAGGRLGDFDDRSVPDDHRTVTGWSRLRLAVVAMPR